MRIGDLGQIATQARRTDEASFLAAWPRPCLLLTGPGTGASCGASVIELEGGPTVVTLGRGSRNDIVAPWPSISRQHALVITGSHETFLVDRRSSNGTFVGDERLLADRPHPLREEDEIRFGHELRGVLVTGKGLLARVRRLL